MKTILLLIYFILTTTIYAFLKDVVYHEKEN